MELNPGFKFTEVGAIPDDWKTAPLGDLKLLMTNGFVGTATPHYTTNSAGVLYIQGYNVEENSFNFHGVKFVTEEFHKAHMKSCLRGDDLLTVQTGDVGLTTIVPDWLSGSNCHALIITRLDQRNAYPRFISYYLNSIPGRARLRLIETGTTMKHLNVGDMLHFVVPLPPLPEQRAIAAALSDADALIASLDALIAKKRDLKQAAMQQLLTGKTRLPGFSGEGSGYKTTEVGIIPEDWAVKKLGDVLLRGRLGGNYPNQPAETEYPLMKMGNIARGYFDVGKVEFIVGGLAPESTHRLAAGDVLFNTRNTLDLVGKVAIWRNEMPVAYYNSNLMRLEFDPREIGSNEYANYALNAVSSVDRLRDLATGTTSVAAIYTRDLMNFQMIIPPKSEQIAIARVLSDMDVELRALERQRTKIGTLKQGMMQELLTGRIRLI